MSNEILALAVEQLKQNARDAAAQAAGQGGPLDGVDPNGWEPNFEIQERINQLVTGQIDLPWIRMARYSQRYRVEKLTKWLLTGEAFENKQWVCSRCGNSLSSERVPMGKGGHFKTRRIYCYWCD